MKISFKGMDSFINSGRRFVHSSELDQLGTSGDNEENKKKGDKEHGQKSINGRKIHFDSHFDDEKHPPSAAVESQPVPGVSYSDVAKIDPGSTVSIDELADSYDGKGQSRQHQTSQNGDANDHARNREKTRPLDVRGKTVVVIGSGASGVEAAEWAFEKGAGNIYLLAR